MLHLDNTTIIVLKTGPSPHFVSNVVNDHLPCECKKADQLQPHVVTVELLTPLVIANDTKTGNLGINQNPNPSTLIQTQPKYQTNVRMLSRMG